MDMRRCAITLGAGWQLVKDGKSIERGLRALDGERWPLLIVAKVPDGVDFRDTSGRDYVEYMQCAGSAERLSLEIRRREGDAFRHYTVGRPGGVGDHSSRLDHVIRFGERKVTVAKSEVYTAVAATPIFLTYLDTGDVGEDVVLRELDLS